jgi:hypothetical protein
VQSDYTSVRKTAISAVEIGVGVAVCGVSRTAA